jgi:hypothetical protein
MTTASSNGSSATCGEPQPRRGAVVFPDDEGADVSDILSSVSVPTLNLSGFYTLVSQDGDLSRSAVGPAGCCAPTVFADVLKTT